MFNFHDYGRKGNNHTKNTFSKKNQSIGPSKGCFMNLYYMAFCFGVLKNCHWIEGVFEESHLGG